MPLVQLNARADTFTAADLRQTWAPPDARRSATPPPGQLPHAQPAQVARAFLTALEARDLETAKSLLGPGFTMEFPGAAPMTRLEELIAWAQNRYRFVKKTIQAVEELQNGPRDRVYVIGTLSGEWLDGTGFEGIRFIDRFELDDGKLVLQQVWNDLAEERPT